jgi:hypothetical protein
VQSSGRREAGVSDSITCTFELAVRALGNPCAGKNVNRDTVRVPD